MATRRKDHDAVERIVFNDVGNAKRISAAGLEVGMDTWSYGKVAEVITLPDERVLRVRFASGTVVDLPDLWLLYLR